MPPRLFTWAIVAFWLTTTGWLIYREIWPRLDAGHPPPFTLDLTDEVGANTSGWTVLHNGKRVGTGLSWAHRRSDRTYELASEFKFDNVGLLQWGLRRVTNIYRVSEDGVLLAFTTTVRVYEKKLTGKDSFFNDNEFIFDTWIADNLFHFKIRLNGTEVPLKLEPVATIQNQNVFNREHLVNKILGLEEGKTWKVPTLDLLPAILKALGVPGTNILPELHAEVHRDSLVWHEKPVDCFRIDYRETGQDVSASTWVRRRDGLVLQQEVKNQGLELKLVREGR